MAFFSSEGLEPGTTSVLRYLRNQSLFFNVFTNTYHFIFGYPRRAVKVMMKA